MKKTLLIWVFIALFVNIVFDCISSIYAETINEYTEEIQEEQPDYEIFEDGSIQFKDWETAYRYASKDCDMAYQLLYGCYYTIQSIMQAVSSGMLTEEEGEIYFNEQIEHMKKLNSIIKKHETVNELQNNNSSNNL